MAAIQNVGKIADAIAPVLGNRYNRRRDLSGAARIERCEFPGNSHFPQDLKDRSVSETVYIPIPCFQRLLRAVKHRRRSSSDGSDKPLPVMKEIDEFCPVHSRILREKKIP